MPWDAVARRRRSPGCALGIKPSNAPLLVGPALALFAARRCAAIGYARGGHRARHPRARALEGARRGQPPAAPQRRTSARPRRWRAAAPAGRGVDLHRTSTSTGRTSRQQLDQHPRALLERRVSSSGSRSPARSARSAARGRGGCCSAAGSSPSSSSRARADDAHASRLGASCADLIPTIPAFAPARRGAAAALSAPAAPAAVGAGAARAGRRAACASTLVAGARDASSPSSRPRSPPACPLRSNPRHDLVLHAERRRACRHRSRSTGGWRPRVSVRAAPSRSPGARVRPPAAPWFYHVFRAPASQPVTCDATDGGAQCRLTCTTVAATSTARATSTTLRPGQWRYRIAAAANWLNDPSTATCTWSAHAVDASAVVG